MECKKKFLFAKRTHGLIHTDCKIMKTVFPHNINQRVLWYIFYIQTRNLDQLAETKAGCWEEFQFSLGD